MKLQRSNLKEYLKFKIQEFDKNPALTVFEKLRLMQEAINTTMEEFQNEMHHQTAEQFTELSEAIQEQISTSFRTLNEALQQQDTKVEIIKENLSTKIPTVDEIVSRVLPLIPLPQDGKSPSIEELEAIILPLIPEAEDGITPIPGIDYPTEKELVDIVIKEVNKGIAKNKKEIQKEIKNLPKLSFEEIARGIEALPLKKKLDYWKGLKNQPDTAKKEVTMRGGGEKVEYYDLSNLCDGSRKTFPIPANKKIIWVSGTDAPGGQYRKTTDWTGSGTVTLTLTDEVAAPTQGATLHIIYVP